MKKITNKSLGIIGVILLILGIISSIKTGTTSENIELLFPILYMIVGSISFIYLIMISIRLWSKNKTLVSGIIIISIISIFIQSIDFITTVIFYILEIIMIIKLFNSNEINIKGETNIRKQEKHKFYSIFIITIYIFFLLGWVLNIIRLFHSDFDKPFKAEVVRGIGIIVFPIGSIIGYIPIKD